MQLKQSATMLTHTQNPSASESKASFCGSVGLVKRMLRKMEAVISPYYTVIYVISNSHKFGG